MKPGELDGIDAAIRSGLPIPPEDLLRLTAMLREADKGVLCIWCNERRPDETPEDRLKGIVEHTKTCEASPWRALETVLRRIDAAYKAKNLDDLFYAIRLAQAVLAAADDDDVPSAMKLNEMIARYDAEPKIEPDCENNVHVPSPENRKLGGGYASLSNCVGCDEDIIKCEICGQWTKDEDTVSLGEDGGYACRRCDDEEDEASPATQATNVPESPK